MDRTKKFVVALSALTFAAAGCKSCGDDPSGNNGVNLEPNNTTSNNTTANNANNGTTVVECDSTVPLEIPNTGDVIVERGEAGVCYSSGDFSVRADQLVTIEAGVVIEFEEGAVLEVAADGKLNMDGTEAAPIVLRGEREVPGWWGGVSIDRGNSIDNIIDWVVIQHAGRDQEAALTIKACCGAETRWSVTNSIFEFSESLGFYAGNNVHIEKFEDNTMRENTEGAAYVHATTMSDIGTGNTFQGNEVDVVFTEGRVSDGEVHNWDDFDVPLQVVADIEAGSESSLFIGPGMTLKFEEGTGIDIDRACPFAVLGEEGNETLLTGTEEVRGHWSGVKIDRGNFDENVFSNTIIEYAGRDSAGGLVLNTCCGEGAQFGLDSVTIRETDGFGLVLDADVSLPTFENVTITANALGAIKTPMGNVAQITTGGTFTGNDIDIIEIDGGSIADPGVVWANPGVPFRVTSDLTTAVMSTLELAPGTVFEFEPTLGLSFGANSGFSAVGTATEPIVFKGTLDDPGHWEGLDMDRLEWVDNALEFVEIANTGSGSLAAALNITACCGDTTAMRLNDLTIRSSTKPAMRVPDGNGTFTGCSNLTFTDTAGEVVIGSVSGTLADFQATCQ